jgi:hypothetical protein
MTEKKTSEISPEICSFCGTSTIRYVINQENGIIICSKCVTKASKIICDPELDKMEVVDINHGS